MLAEHCELLTRKQNEMNKKRENKYIYIYRYDGNDDQTKKSLKDSNRIRIIHDIYVQHTSHIL